MGVGACIWGWLRVWVWVLRLRVWVWVLRAGERRAIRGEGRTTTDGGGLPATCICICAHSAATSPASCAFDTLSPGARLRISRSREAAVTLRSTHKACPNPWASERFDTCRTLWTRQARARRAPCATAARLPPARNVDKEVGPEPRRDGGRPRGRGARAHRRVVLPLDGRHRVRVSHLVQSQPTRAPPGATRGVGPACNRPL